VQPGSTGGFHKVFFGSIEIAIPIYGRSVEVFQFDLSFAVSMYACLLLCMGYLIIPQFRLTRRMMQRPIDAQQKCKKCAALTAGTGEQADIDRDVLHLQWLNPMHNCTYLYH
jgi:hypothetical protein